MSMMRPSTRLLAVSRSNLVAARSIQRQSLRAPPSASYALQRRTYAEGQAAGGGGHSNSSQTIIIVGVLLALGAGGYYMLKPVADVASTAKGVVDQGKAAAGQAGSNLNMLAGGFLPPAALAMYDKLSSSPGGLNGFLSSLKDKDLQGVIGEVKKVGGDDVKRIVDKVEAKVKAAKGNVKEVDWKSLAQELKKDLPKDKQQYVDMLIGYIPDKADFDQMIKKIRSEAADQVKQLEAASSKVWQQVEKAKKEGKGQADSFLKGLKQATPEDLDEFVKQIKEAAKKAGLPADQIESWLKSKADEKNIDPEALAKQFQDKLKTAEKFLPGDPKDLVNQVGQISPSAAKLLEQAMQQAGIMK